MEIVTPLALLAVGFLTGWAWHARWMQAEAHDAYTRGWADRGTAIGRALPGPVPAYLPHLDPERRAGCKPAAPYLIIRADDPGAPMEYQYHE